jgi:hypothetical protein
MQKPRPKEATVPQRQRSPNETDTSTRGASAPFVIPEGEKAAETLAPSVSETLAKQADTDPGVIRNEASSRLESWEAIGVGDLVIAHESPEDGWWEAIVVAVENDQLLLRWRDYPRQPCVRRGRLGVALLPPVAA